MAFPEDLKLRVKKKANFRCCICQAIEVEIHHIVPQANDGPDTEDNAAPLCGQCHNVYGGNPEKKKFIREARDHWYEKCEEMYVSDPEYRKEIKHLTENVATKADLDRALGRLMNIIEGLRNAPPSDPVGLRDVAIATNTAVASLSSVPYSFHVGTPFLVFKRCTGCNTQQNVPIGVNTLCPNCKSPW